MHGTSGHSGGRGPSRPLSLNLLPRWRSVAQRSEFPTSRRVRHSSPSAPVSSSDARSVAGAILRGWFSRLVRYVARAGATRSCASHRGAIGCPPVRSVRSPADRSPRGRGDPSPRSRRQRPAGRTAWYVEGRLTTHAPALDIARSQPIPPTSCERSHPGRGCPVATLRRRLGPRAPASVPCVDRAVRARDVRAPAPHRRVVNLNML